MLKDLSNAPLAAEVSMSSARVPKQKRPATSRDVARRAGVPQSTVSYFFNQVPGRPVSPAAQERIRAAAQALGYEPNIHARALRIGTQRRDHLYPGQPPAYLRHRRTHPRGAHAGPRAGLLAGHLPSRGLPAGGVGNVAQEYLWPIPGRYRRFPLYDFGAGIFVWASKWGSRILRS